MKVRSSRPAAGPTPGVLLAVFGLLLGLLVLTALAAHWSLGRFSVPVALGIAAAKAALIFLFFMQLRYRRDGLVRVFAVAGFFWLALAGVLTLCDYLTRPQ